MPAKTLMVQRAASFVGKSVMVSALCRILRQDGWNVAPFKSQNMSLNLHVTVDGDEMGRSILGELAARMGVDLRLGDKVFSKEEQYNNLASLVRGSRDMELVYRLIDGQRR
jgi:hypothetical protein